MIKAHWREFGKVEIGRKRAPSPLTGQPDRTFGYKHMQIWHLGFFNQNQNEEASLMSVTV